MPLSDKVADVTLVLEGTYPFVRGGVSGWVHQLIEGLPEFTFSLVYLGASQPDREKMQYTLPANVVALACHSLADNPTCGRPKARAGDPRYFTQVEELHAWFRHPDSEPDPAWAEGVIAQQHGPDGTCGRDFFFSEAAWNQIRQNYERYCPDASFIDYFWAVRNMHGPLMKLGSIAATVPRSRLIHCVTTGYAGLLGVMLKHRTGSPMVLTEHGIYTKERKIDLHSLLLRDSQGWFAKADSHGMAHHDLIWVRLFEGIGRLTYAAADQIITLYEQNRLRQIHDGADPSRTRIIPNGVDVARFAPLRSQRPREIPMVLGFIGRVVPIKDIKTFIRMIGVLSDRLPNIQGWIAGPQEEDPDYVDECKALTRHLRLEDHIRFLGFQAVEDIFPQLGLLVLTSISEAFPLVIGESHASGLPVLATDVGACRELITGRDAADRDLGPAGQVVPIADHEALARAAFSLLTDPVRWTAAQVAGIQRVERYYRQSEVIGAYRHLYQKTGEI